METAPYPNEDHSVTKTKAMLSPSSSSVTQGQFPAGSLVGGRYRIMALVGHGGMGEVYRAHDLILDQLVALKFLPAAASANESALTRFRNEARVARQVTHPTVCRVYDIGVADGLHYISMEYIDGEDLASLLRRIGRVPHDKAVEVTRRLCAGLGAAHERGVLHRDLKPGNIMIDGRGNVHIADFGLSVLGAIAEGPDIRSGTSLYMAPEQLSGTEVTGRSDLYALGLVLYEMFTGKRPFEASTVEELGRMRSTSLPAPPSTLVKDMSPAVERAILHCLEPDPRRRPASAVAVAMELPGGDPIAVALAAGETPSPEMVAASGEREGFRPAVAAAWFALLVAGLALLPLLNDRIHPAGVEPPSFPREVMEVKASEMLRRLGWPLQNGFRSATDFRINDEVLTLGQARRGLDGGFRRHDPPLFVFWRRELPAGNPAVAFFNGKGTIAGRISESDPPRTAPGETLISLDVAGKLLSLEVRPADAGLPPIASEPSAPAIPLSAGSSPVTPRQTDGVLPTTMADRQGGPLRSEGPTSDWSRLLGEAGFRMDQLKPTTPREIPMVPFDVQAAWEGAAWADGTIPLRIEAAAWRGRPVYFEIRPTPPLPPGGAPGKVQGIPQALAILAQAAIMGLAVLACWIARRNLHAGRTDRVGAARIFAVLFSLIASQYLTAQSHVSGLQELQVLMQAIGWAVFSGMFGWVTYQAIEPAARRFLPRLLVSWSRLMAGRLRDPLLASHVLAGIAIGVAAHQGHAVWTLLSGRLAFIWNWVPLEGASILAGVSLRAAVVFEIGLAFVLVWVLLERLLRRTWSVRAVLSLLLLLVIDMRDIPWQAMPVVVATIGALVIGIDRFGLAGLIGMASAWAVVARLPLTTNLDAWYSVASLWGVAVLVAVAVYAMYIILHGRPLGAESLTYSQRR